MSSMSRRPQRFHRVNHQIDAFERERELERESKREREREWELKESGRVCMRAPRAAKFHYREPVYQFHLCGHGEWTLATRPPSQPPPRSRRESDKKPKQTSKQRRNTQRYNKCVKDAFVGPTTGVSLFLGDAQLVESSQLLPGSSC